MFTRNGMDKRGSDIRESARALSAHKPGSEIGREYRSDKDAQRRAGKAAPDEMEFGANATLGAKAIRLSG